MSLKFPVRPEQPAFVQRSSTLVLARLDINEKGQPIAYPREDSFTNSGFEIPPGRGSCGLLISDVTPEIMTGTLDSAGMDPIAAHIDLE